MKLQHEVKQLAYKVGGSHNSVSDRRKMIIRFVNYLKQNNIQIKQIEHLKVRHIEEYIQHRLSQNKNKRTLHNEMSAIRTTLKQAGRAKLVQSERLTNKAPGPGNASRQGSKTAISDQHYQNVQQSALQKNQGLAAALWLARVCGLRGQEAIQSMHSLNTWQTALEQGKTTLPVTFGTKGGRPRETRIIDREQAKQAVAFALRVAQQQNGKLIDKASLKGARNYWRNQCSALGLTGRYAPHSLRYAFAKEATDYYRQQGFSKKEAFALVSMDLGHGDGRGRYVERVYNIDTSTDSATDAD